MSATVLSLLRERIGGKPQPRDWSNQELAEFYRVEASLINKGLRIETERGLSDEGDPWFVFCRRDDNEMIAHFARIGGQYVVACPTEGKTAVGDDFRSLIGDVLDGQMIVFARHHRTASNVLLHPSALLLALVASAYFKYSEAAVANDRASHSDPNELRDWARTASSGASENATTHAIGLAEIALIVSAIASLHGDAALRNDPSKAPTTAAVSSDETVITGAHSPTIDLVDYIRLDAINVAANSAIAAPVADDANATHAAIPLFDPLNSVVQLSYAERLDSVPVDHDIGRDWSSGKLVILSDFAANLGAEIALNVVLPQTSNVGNGSTTPTKAIEFVLTSNVVPLNAAIHVDQLPQNLATILGTSVHEAVSGTPAPSTLGTTPTTIAMGPQLAANPVVTSVTHDNTIQSNVTFTLANVLQEINQFEAIAPSLKVVLTAQSAVIYDPGAVDHNFAQVHSVTFDFNDGSHLSIVGTSHELSQLHA
jgi:hypothetical protein